MAPHTDDRIAFSVIIPAYNAEAHIAETVLSACRQDLAPLEIIVVDDGSTDGTSGIARRASELVRCHSQENAGVAAARNAGLRLARGTHVAFLDADDRWLPHHLGGLAEAFSRFDVKWCASAYLLRWETDPPRELVRLAPGVRGDGPVMIENYFEASAQAWGVWTSACAVERGFLTDHDGFDERLRTGEDLDLWFRLALDEPRLGYVPRPSAIYRQVADSLTHSDNDPVDGWYPVLRRMRERACDHGGDAAQRALPLMRRFANGAARAIGRQGDRARARDLLAEAGPLMSPSVRARLACTLLMPAAFCRRLWALRR